MEAYDKEEKPDLADLKNDMIALVRAAIGAVARPSPLHEQITQSKAARYSMMMLLDSEAEEEFVKFLDECQRKPAERGAILQAMKRMVAQKEYFDKFTAFLRAMLRTRDNSQVALDYIAKLGNKELAFELKKELVIFARGDIGENQLNAMDSLALIPKDEDSIKTFTVLLSHWDETARHAAAEIILKHKTEEGISAAKKRIGSETDPEIKMILEKIIK